MHQLHRNHIIRGRLSQRDWPADCSGLCVDGEIGRSTAAYDELQFPGCRRCCDIGFELMRPGFAHASCRDVRVGDRRDRHNVSDFNRNRIAADTIAAEYHHRDDRNHHDAQSERD